MNFNSRHRHIEISDSHTIGREVNAADQKSPKIFKIESLGRMHLLTALLRLFPLLPTSGAILLALTVLQPENALAQKCELDPFGAEVCLPPEPVDPPVDPPVNPTPPPSKAPTPEPTPVPKPDVPVVIFDCFGPCREFPPAPPYRQFEEAAEPMPDPEPEAAPVLTPEPTSVPVPDEPIRPLWFKSDALDHTSAETYLNQTLRNHYLAQSNQGSVEFDRAPIVLFDGVRYVEILEPNTVLISRDINEPSLNVWVRGFGGNSANGASGSRYAEIKNGGAQLGFDIPLSHSTRIGLFGTYAAMRGEDGSRGSWDADGWGGGGYAEYWSDNFYLRGMLSAGSYDGEHRRTLKNDTASGNRSGNSWSGTVSLGAPFDSGDWILEPQALVSYTKSNLDSFSEGGVKRSKRLRYHDLQIDSVDTELAFKFTRPIRDGQRSLFMPSLRVGWVADWGQNGDSQKVSYIDSGDSYRTSINGDVDHGALIELGLDYTTYNFNDTSMGVYARSGVVLWGGERGTSWQVQGGLNFKF